MIYVNQQSAYQEVMYSNSARILDSSVDDPQKQGSLANKFVSYSWQTINIDKNRANCGSG